MRGSLICARATRFAQAAHASLHVRCAKVVRRRLLYAPLQVRAPAVRQVVAWGGFHRQTSSLGLMHGSHIQANSVRTTSSRPSTGDVSNVGDICHVTGANGINGSDIGGETHGGDDIHRVHKLVCDFSVTTNALGPVHRALEATKKLLECEITFSSARGGDVKALLDESSVGFPNVAYSPAVEHYPPRVDAELEYLTASFLRGQASAEETQTRLLFGNGASELIDLLIRLAPKGPYCLNPNADVQYREYERACKNGGREQVYDPKTASVVCLVNPNNPTGEFQDRMSMESWIAANVAPGCWAIVDESMLFWRGPHWREDSVSTEFIKSMAQQNVHIFLVQSWTKIFSCTGLRIGSVLCPTADLKGKVQAMLVPWSVTVFARTYLKAALQDTEYMVDTWRVTPLWREHMVTRLQKLHPQWQFLGAPWLSWIWIDTGSVEAAAKVYDVALKSGCPVRHALHGYNRPTMVRIAVRRPHDFIVLYQALVQQEYDLTGQHSFGTFADVHPSVVDGVTLVHLDELLPHEAVIEARSQKLREYVEELPSKVLPAIIIDGKHKVVLDGHHRLNLFKEAGLRIVPVVLVNYDHEDILVNPPSSGKTMQKATVINSARNGQLLPPKTTQHMVRCRNGALMPLISLAPQIAEVVG